jgi:hypothetical protein
MIVTSGTLVCGTSFLVVVLAADPDGPSKAQVHRFGDQTIVVQPGPVAAKMPMPVRSEPQLAHRTQEFPPLPALPPTDVTPEPRSEFDVAAPDSSPAPNANGLELARRDREIYNTIPFDRVEYDANPSYRHEAAMEMLFGKMRPTVVHRSHTTIDVHTPPVPPMAMPYSPYGFNSYFFPFFSPGYRVHRSF